MNSIEKNLPPKVRTDILRDHFRSTYKLADDQIDIMLASSAKSLTSVFSALYAALDDNEGLDKIYRLAHSIKGLLLNMGETQWAELAREVELAASASEERDYRNMVKKIQYGVEDIL